MPHTLVDITGGGDLRFASELNGNLITKAVDDVDLPFLVERTEEFDVIAGGGPGEVAIDIQGLPGFDEGEYIMIKEGANEEVLRGFGEAANTPLAGQTRITFGPQGPLVNAYTTAAKIYRLKTHYDRIVINEPGNPETTVLSIFGHSRDQMVFRKKLETLVGSTLDFAAGELGLTGFSGLGTASEQVEEFICELLFPDRQLSCDDRGIDGEGTLNPGTNLEDGGPFVSHSCATFESQFEDAAGTATFDEYIFEIPFDTFLTRASIFTNASTAADAYVTITKNDVTPIVDAGPVPPNRNLPAVTGVLKGLDLPAIPVVKGDKITVRLNFVLANVIKRAKVVLTHAPRLKNI